MQRGWKGRWREGKKLGWDDGDNAGMEWNDDDVDLARSGEEERSLFYMIYIYLYMKPILFHPTCLTSSLLFHCRRWTSVCSKNIHQCLQWMDRPGRKNELSCIHAPVASNPYFHSLQGKGYIDLIDVQDRID